MDKLADLRTDKKLTAVKQKWISNESIISLNRQKPEIFSLIDPYFKVPDESVLKIYISARVMFAQILIFSIYLIFIIMLIIEYFTGLLLYKILKRRL